MESHLSEMRHRSCTQTGRRTRPMLAQAGQQAALPASRTDGRFSHILLVVGHRLGQSGNIEQSKSLAWTWLYLRKKMSGFNCPKVRLHEYALHCPKCWRESCVRRADLSLLASGQAGKTARAASKGKCWVLCEKTPAGPIGTVPMAIE